MTFEFLAARFPGEARCGCSSR